MAINQKRNWLIGYDIACPRRLNKIHRRLSKDALPVQYSLFLYNGDRRETRKLLDELALIMNAKEDDLRAYPIPNNAEINHIGQSGILDRIILTDDVYGETLSVIKLR
jgi:Uncharacterized protein predicted to be involved in DNA repair